MFWFLVRFFALFIVLFYIELLNLVQSHIILPWTNFLAELSANILMLFDSDVMYSGNIVLSKSQNFGVSILPGCNGVEAVLILVAAVLSFRATWRQKLVGIFIGAAMVQALNLLRIVSLYYLGLWDRFWFDFAHLYLWQALIMLDVLIIWLIWVRFVFRARAVVAERGGSEND